MSILAASQLSEKVELQDVDYVLEPSRDSVGSRFDALVERNELRRTDVNADGGQAPQVEGANVDNVDDSNNASLPPKKKLRLERMTQDELAVAVGELSRFVEHNDCCAPDPVFLVYLKASRNTVPVPRHWGSKSAYLSRQTDRPPATYVVPPFIEVTGVGAMRNGNWNLKELARPFLQANPATPGMPLLGHGDVFYDGKDIRSLRKAFTPGVLSEALRSALGMGPASPPPWLHAMQQLACLPPAYPKIKIPGLNAPIPAGAQWGYSASQWGQPPRTESGAFLFPSVMPGGETKKKLLLWGTPTGENKSDVPPVAVQNVSPPPPPAAPVQPVAPVNPMSAFVPPPMPMPMPMGIPMGIAQWAQEYARVDVGMTQGLLPSSYVLQQRGALPVPPYPNAFSLPPQPPKAN